MTTIATIVERFTMTLEEPAEGHDEWFLDWVLRSPKHAGTHLTAGWLTLGSLTRYLSRTDIQSCVEYFGGMGAQAMMVQEIWAPPLHIVQDYSQEAVDHIDRVLGYGPVIANQADAYDPTNGHLADLVMLDFGDLTAWKTRAGEPHRRLLDQVFSRDPRAVVFTDIAARYLHLHRERYEGLLGAGTCGSYESYLEALLARLQALYGYTLVSGSVDRWSTVMALMPEGEAPVGSLTPTPPSPVGLELL